MINKFLTNKFLKNLENIKYGKVKITTPDNQVFEFGDTPPYAEFNILDYSVISMIIAKGDIGLAESYRDGLWETSDITVLLDIAAKNIDILEDYIYGNSIFNLGSRFLYFLNRNTVKGSKKNIHAHYDLGNEFYSLWLDETMTYSSAIFDKNCNNLHKAQLNKYDRIISKLNEGQTLEIGCGWGGFAERAKNREIKGITISKSQYDFAKTRLGDEANIVLEDYRQQNGKFDNIVSIEMFEAVGEKYWPIYFNKIKSLLSNRGSAIIQTININDQYFNKYRKTADMIRTYVFPGGMLPSMSRFVQESEKSGLKITDKYSFGHDYAKTLSIWLKRFDDNIHQIKDMGFDDKFIRLWRFYLANCMAGFSSNRTDVMQIELKHA